jgi:ribose-phosphate pyrophosphokinase
MPARDAPLLFALAPSEALGRAIARDLGIELAEHEDRRFDDGERKTRPRVGVRGRDVYVVCSLYGSGAETVHDRLCRLLFFLGAVRASGAGRITVVAPYLCYTRKERKTNPRDPVTTQDVARLFEAVGVDRFLTVDVHNLPAYENAFRIAAEHLEAKLLFVARSRGLGDRPITVVSPDPGGFHRAEAVRDALAEATGAQVELAMLGKYRHAGVLRSEAFVGEVAGRTAVIIDDLIVTGSTLVRAADACRSRGALAVHAMATHGMFSAAAREVLASPLLDSLVITDTVAPDRVDLGAVRDKLSVVSVVPLLARAIGALHAEGSLTRVREAP